MRKRRISIGKIDFELSLGSNSEKKSTSTIGIELGMNGKKVSSKRLSFSNSARDIFQEAIKEANPIPIDTKTLKRRSQTFSNLDQAIFGSPLFETSSVKDLEKVSTENLPERGLHGYELNFDSIFTKSEIKEAFRAYLRSEFNPEPFEFLLYVKAIPQDKSKETVSLFFKIIDTFIKSGSEQELNLLNALKVKFFEEISKQKVGEKWVLNRLPYEYLTMISRAVLDDLYYDSFSRFKKSDLCYDAVLGYAKDENVITKVPHYVVVFKLKKTFYFQKMNENELLRFALKLSKVEGILDSYLSKDWKGHIKSFDKSLKEEKKYEKIIQQKIENKINVKLLFLEKKHSDFKRQSVANFFSPVLTRFSVLNEFEEFYPALMIGPWLLEWNKDEIIIPKACVSESAVLTADLPSLISFDNINEILEKIAKCIIYWNTNKQFCLHPTDEKQGNSFDFVEDLMKIIGSSLPTDGPIGEFLRDSKRLGMTKLEFKLSTEFKNHFGLKKDIEKFRTHQQLDSYVDNLLEIDEELPSKFSSEYLFLKGIDRAFWMKSFHYENEIHQLNEDQKISSEEKIQQLKSLNENVEKFKDSYCPFSDPRKTKSILL
eukprot:gene26-4277_t